MPNDPQTTDPQLSKPWYQSLTAWVLVILASLGAVEQVGGLPVGTTVETESALEGLLGALHGGMLSFLSLIGLYGRSKAKGPVTLT